jgi:hypothetical protein
MRRAVSADSVETTIFPQKTPYLPKNSLFQKTRALLILSPIQ